MYLFLTIILILFLIIFYNDNSIYIKSDIDQKYYLVNDLENSKQASNLLSYLYNVSNMLINNILNDFDSTDEDDQFYRHFIIRIYNKLSTLKIKESALNDKNNTYSINKGEEIRMCLRNKNSLELHNKNLLLYVMIHELAHIGCPEIGHTKLFHNINLYILKKAIKYNFYYYDKYDNQAYCGLNLTSSILD